MNQGFAIVSLLLFSAPALAAGNNAAQGMFECTSGQEAPRKFLDNGQAGADYKEALEAAVKEKFPNGKVKCTSCHRTVNEQKSACRRACNGNENGCSGTCATPGRSNHQLTTTCDISGLPNVQQGCDFLAELCLKMKEKHPEGKCGVGGYPGGSHHFGFGPEINDSAWNQCTGVKAKLGMSPGRLEQLQDRTGALWQRIKYRTGFGETH